MENHPIPQDVTGFQFKLIGDMTVKQFAYVAVGAILAFAFFYAPISPFIKIPFAILFALIGVAMAFLPIEGRPADAMMSYFLKALVTPNQYAYHKIGGVIGIFTIQTTQHTLPTSLPTKRAAPVTDEAKARQLQQYLLSMQKHTASPLDKKEEMFLQHVLTPTSLPPATQPELPSTPPAPNQPKKADGPLTPKEIEEQEANLSLQAASIKYELNEAKEHETEEKDAAKTAAAHEQVQSLQQKLDALLKEKQELEQQLQVLKGVTKPQSAPRTETAENQEQVVPDTKLVEQVKQELAPQPQAQAPTVTPIQKPAPPQATASPTVRKIPADLAKSIGLPHMPDVANLIVGIIKDPRGNILQNILVEVKDKDGIPARAFRTNSLGQFASATPLSTGTYTMEFEDPKAQAHFDIIELEAKGEIMLPLEITSHDEREELRKALFS
ncbi:MAG: PrgI family protein [bacterium]|nr:PrgI family protein [bacterium]